MSRLPIGTKIWVGKSLGACRGGWATLKEIDIISHPGWWSDTTSLAAWLEDDCDAAWSDCPNWVHIAEQLFADGSLEWPL